nr:LysR family transcriptional regulator [Streptomyces scabichelini]
MCYLLAVADEGTFTKAAEHLGVTHPALSRAIRSLEDAVGTALFSRAPHGAELTEAGRMLSQEARNLVESADAALAHGWAGASTVAVFGDVCTVEAVPA